MSNFRASNGVMQTQALFYEFNNPDAPYTLRDEDFTNRAGKTYKSAAAIYREAVDEYDAAIKIVGSWTHWEKLLGLKWFVEGIHTGGYNFGGVGKWREEMALRDASFAKSQLVESAEAGNVTAQRYLHETATKGSKGKAGRPESKKPAQPVSGAVAQFQKINGGKT